MTEKDRIIRYVERADIGLDPIPSFLDSDEDYNNALGFQTGVKALQEKILAYLKKPRKETK